MEERVSWVVKELISRLVESGYIVYVHYSESGSVYITIDLGLGPRIRVSNHDIVYTEGVDLNIQPIYRSGSNPVYVRLRKSTSVIDKVLTFTFRYVESVKYDIASTKYNKLVEHRHLNGSVIYEDLFEICSMFSNKEYKNRLGARVKKSERSMKKYKNKLYFYK